MNPTLQEEDIAEYAVEAQTIQEPVGDDYAQGVHVGRTIPAKWWNWLFNAVTKRLHQAFSDLTNIFTELKYLLIDVGITPSSSDNTQITQAVVAKANTQIDVYVAKNKLQLYKYWKPTANMGLAHTYSGCLEYENGALISSVPTKGTDAGYVYAQYSLDGGEIWHNFEAQPGYFFIPNSFVNGKYVGINTREYQSQNKIEVRVMEAATIGGLTSPYTYLDTIEIPVSDFSIWYDVFWTVIGTDLFYMTRHGVFIKYDSVLKKLSNTGITAADLNLPPTVQTTAFNSCVEAKQIGGKYFVGNLMYDGINWTNVCPTIGSTDITPTPELVRPNRVASNDKVYFTRVFYESDKLLSPGSFNEQLKAEKVAVYDLNTGVSTVLPYYTWYNQVDDVLICFKDFEHNDFTLMYSYDCANFTEIPLAFSTTSYNTNVIQLDSGYLIKSATVSGTSIRLHYIRGSLSDDASKYELRSTLALIGSVQWYLLVRGFVNGDVGFLINAANNTTTRGFCVYDKGAIVEELSIDNGVSTYSGKLIAPTLRTSLMPYVKMQPFSAYGNTGYPLMVTKPTVNTVTNHTLYLK